jgi:predicted acyltransferase
MAMDAKQRLLSLDALRGFDMFWIIGGEEIFAALAKVTDHPLAHWWSHQLHHVAWAGFQALDLVFPLFVFIAGVAIPFALTRKLEQGEPRKRLVLKVLRRAGLLVGLGLVYNGLLDLDFGNLRVASVLAQIGLAYMIAALITLFFRSVRAQILWCVGILAGYAILQLFIPVPGHGAGVLTPEGCINGYIDRLFLPGRLYGGEFDPEGLLCIVSAGGLCLMGSLAGSVLRSDKLENLSKLALLAGCGMAFIVLGKELSPWYPLIKAAWTTTFNLVAGGISLLLLTLFYLVIDVWKFRKGSFILRVIGLNSITIYMGTRLIDFEHTSRILFGGLAAKTGDWEPFVLCVSVVVVEWLFLWFLYKKQVFLKV